MKNNPLDQVNRHRNPDQKRENSHSTRGNRQNTSTREMDHDENLKREVDREYWKSMSDLDNYERDSE